MRVRFCRQVYRKAIVACEELSQNEHHDAEARFPLLLGFGINKTYQGIGSPGTVPSEARTATVSSRWK